MSRLIPADLEAQIRWRNEHPSAPQSHEWGISDRRVLLAEVNRLRGELERIKTYGHQAPLFVMAQAER